MGSFRKPEMRFVLPEPATKLRKLLDLPFAYEEVQDWEILCAKGARVAEFLEHYERAADELTDDDKFALMALIVASFDDWLADGGKMEPIASRVCQQLNRDFDIHAFTVWYWSLWDVDSIDPDHVFQVTPMMREVRKRG